MNILLIGGAGYLGIPLSRKLKSNGHSVTVYDCFKYNTQEHFHSSDCYVIGEVKNINNNLKCDLNSFDIILYLAQPRLCELVDIQQVKDSISDFNLILDILNGPKLIFISSCSVYGKTTEIVNENSHTTVTSLYSQMKIFCESLLLEKQNPNYKILRLSTLYGESDYTRNDVFINDMLNEILKGNSIEIYDPTAKRPHLHVLDCAKIITQLLETGFDEKVLNIGYNDLNINKRDIINLIKSFVEFDLIEHDTYDSRDYHVDFTKLIKYVDNKYISYDMGIMNYLKKEKLSVN